MEKELTRLKLINVEPLKEKKMYKITITELEKIKKHLNDLSVVSLENTMSLDVNNGNNIKIAQRNHKLTKENTKIINSLKDKYDI